jgi:ABC-type multidrug transport system fused ATPase/permease subunit
VAAEVGNDLRLRLLDSLLVVHRLRQPRHGDQGTRFSAGVSALTDRIRDVEVGMKTGLLGGIRAGAQLLPLLVVLVALSQRMAALAFVVLAVFGLVLGRARGVHRRATAEVVRERERLLDAADQSVRHADLWVTFGAERKVRASVEWLGKALGRSAALLDARTAGLSAANEVLAAAALVAALAAARAGWLGKAEDQGALLAFAVAFFMTYRPLRDLTEARLAWGLGRDAYEDLQRATAGEAWTAHETAEQPSGFDHAPAEPGTCRPAPGDEGSELPSWPLASLELRGIRLARGLAQRLSLRIEPGTVVAICGVTGAGKTTLLRTLLGLEQLLEGHIVYGDVPIEARAAGPDSRPFAWVPQDAPLLADTLNANVMLGARSGSDGTEPARQALRSVGAEHIASFLGSERIEGGGRTVSGGERQWIALARAVATQQPVLLLDEPTSAMDGESQRRVLEAISRLKGRRTVVIVTHRPEPLAIADAVVRLGQDEVIGQAA